MYYKILEYRNNPDCHVVEDQNGNRHMIDLTQSGELQEANNALNREKYEKYCRSLIGKVVFVKSAEEYILSGKGIEIMDSAELKNGSLVINDDTIAIQQAANRIGKINL